MAQANGNPAPAPAGGYSGNNSSGSYTTPPQFSAGQQMYAQAPQYNPPPADPNYPANYAHPPPQYAAAPAPGYAPYSPNPPYPPGAPPQGPPPPGPQGYPPPPNPQAPPPQGYALQPPQQYYPQPYYHQGYMPPAHAAPPGGYYQAPAPPMGYDPNAAAGMHGQYAPPGAYGAYPPPAAQPGYGLPMQANPAAMADVEQAAHVAFSGADPEQKQHIDVRGFKEAVSFFGVHLEYRDMLKYYEEADHDQSGHITRDEFVSLCKYKLLSLRRPPGPAPGQHYGQPPGMALHQMAPPPQQPHGMPPPQQQPHK